MSQEESQEESFKEHGIDIEEIMGEYFKYYDDGRFTSFRHITRGLLNVVTGQIELKKLRIGNEDDEGKIEAVKISLERYIELLREFPDFEKEHLKVVSMGSPLGMGSVRDYINGEYERLIG